MFQWTQSSILVRLRLAAALVLVVYAATHFINHALGLISLETMEAGRKIFLAFWRNPVLQFLFPLALFVHVQSALWRLMFRQSWHFSTREKIKICAGLSIPFLLLLHIASTRLQWWVHGFDDNYAYYLHYVFQGAGFYILATMTLIIWVHAYLGVTDVLRLKAWFERYRVTFALAFMTIPLLGVAGILSAKVQVDQLARNPEWVRAIAATHGNPQAAADTQLFYYAIALGVVAVLLITLFLLRILVLRHAARKASITVDYADGRKIRVARGTSLLDGSLLHHIEHAHVCGGNGRCSTCRVRILAGAENLTPADNAERSVLERIGAEDGVRLACQARVSGDVKMALLIESSHATPAMAAQLLTRRAQANGKEKEVVVLFSDLKGFTSFSENKLPYDVVFVLNQYFRAMGKIIESHNGFIDKFIGDGIMAIFGLDEQIDAASKHALVASIKMHEQLRQVNEFLLQELATPLEIRIGLHAGQAIVGEMGYGAATRTTAIGDTVNTASRLEHANKQLKSWLLFSDAVARHARVESKFEEFRSRVLLRGKSHPLEVYAVPKDAKIAVENI